MTDQPKDVTYFRCPPEQAKGTCEPFDDPRSHDFKGWVTFDHVVQLTDPLEIASVRSNDLNDIHGFEVNGVVYGYACSVERWRKVRGEPRNET
jgi:hypothetical protein